MFKLYLLCGCCDEDNPPLSVYNISAVWDDMLCYFDDDIIYVECICLLSVYLGLSCRLFAGKSMSIREVNFTRIESVLM